MKILRLFVGKDLNEKFKWFLIENDQIILESNSTFEEIANLEDAQLEVYLDANCCTIFKQNIAGISNKRLTNELVLGLVEEKLLDNIEDLTASVLRVDEDLAYVAIFNKKYYEALLDKLSSTNKQVRYLSSIVFITIYDENQPTIYLSNKQKFIRISKYEYVLLDDAEPIPLLLKEVLQNLNKKQVLLYGHDKFSKPDTIKTFEASLNVSCNLINDKFEFDYGNWNFFNQKSTSFKIKLNSQTKLELKKLYLYLKYALALLVVFYSISASLYAIESRNARSRAIKDLKNVININQAGTTTSLEVSIRAANSKISSLKHQQGMYNKNDAVSLLNTFLQVVSNLDASTINGFKYDNGKLEVFLTSNFNTKDFASLATIFNSNQINATLKDYKAYTKEQQSSSDTATSSLISGTSSDSQWVITLNSIT